MNSDRQKNEKSQTHECVIKCRNRIDITGVKEVTGFDEGMVELVTDCGELTIEGEGLRVGTLDTDRGIISVGGTISGVVYSDGVSMKKSRRQRGRP